MSKSKKANATRPIPSRLLLYRTHRVAQLLDVDESTVWRWWKKQGLLPAPVTIGGVKGWTQQTIEEFIAARQQADDAAS